MRTPDQVLSPNDQWARRSQGCRWRDKLGRILFPFSCCLCGLDCEQDRPLCDTCENCLKRNSFACPTCALPLAQGTNSTRPSDCGNCLRKPVPFDAVIAPWLYDRAMAHLIGLWKYHGKHWLTPLLAQLWVQHYQCPDYHCGESPQVDLLIPVPLAPMRLMRRGFNQAGLLASEIWRTLPAARKPPVDHTLLRRARHAGVQAGLGAKARLANVDHAFTVHRGCDNLRVAVVDDVVTTAATASEIATELKRRGAARVEIWCIARTPLPERTTQ